MSGTGRNISESVVLYLSEKNISLDEALVDECDGTSINTGLKKGVIQISEMKIGRRLQYRIFLLHLIEFPFRHLFQHIDCKSKGRNCFLVQ